MERNGVKRQWHETWNEIVHQINHVRMLFVQIHLSASIYGTNTSAREYFFSFFHFLFSIKISKEKRTFFVALILNVINEKNVSFIQVKQFTIHLTNINKL